MSVKLEDIQKKITAKDGLLWRDGKIIELPEADDVAALHGYLNAERMVVALTEKEWLRPSMLPKLALCGHYRSEAEAGNAAARGTRLDELFRRHFAEKDFTLPLGDLLTEDADALKWAISTAHALAGGYGLETREEKLRIEALGLTGTADGLCEEAMWSLDLKTGQKRNYLEQQAAYALGFMEQTFTEEWTVYLLYCDQEEVETLRFTRESAEKAVRDVLAKARGDEPPTPNDYCGWCAKRWECQARREAIGILPIGGPAAVALEELPSPVLREFVLRAGVVEDFAEKARGLLKDRIIGGEKVPGCSLVSKKGTRKVLWRWVELVSSKLGLAAIGEAIGGTVSESKLLPLIEAKMPGAKIPDDQIQEMPGSTYVRVGQPKK